MREMDELFAALERSKFRSRFQLGRREREYFDRKGMQTPMHNHPVFIAQHATATCCRACLEKWHEIPRGQELSLDEREYVVQVIQTWLIRQIGEDPQNR